MRKIYTIPFNNNFINSLGQHLYEENKRDYTRKAVVFSGKRPFLYLQRYLSQIMQGPYYPPTLFSVDNFIEYIIDKKYPDVRDLEFLEAIRWLYALWRKKDWDFGQFYPWGIKLLSLLNQIDTEDIENSKLKNIQNNALIGFDIPKSINQILEELVLIRKNFHAKMERDHRFTRGYKYLKAKEFIDQIPLDEFDKIYFAGLFGLTHTTKALIRSLYHTDKAEIIWQVDDIKEWNILQEQAAYFNCEIEALDTSMKKSPEIKLYSCFDVHSEVIKTYEILKKNPVIKNTCIVLPNADVLFPLLSLGIDRLKKTDFNISLSYPVNRTSLFSIIRDILHCQISTRIKGDKMTYYAKDYLNVITHPFIKNLDQARESIQSLEHEIIHKKLPFIHLEQMKLIPEIHQLLFYALENIANLFEAAEAIERILDYILEHSPIRSYILSGEVFNLFFNEIAKIKQCDFAKEMLSSHRIENKNFIVEIITNYLQIQVLPFDTRPLQDLEIIGFLETRNLNFDNLLILNMEEGIVPQEKEFDPLLPQGLYEPLGLPSLKFHEEMYRYYFYRLIQGAQNVHLLYREDKEKKRSRYIEQIIWEEEKQKQNLNVMEIDPAWYKINLKKKTQENEIKKTDLIYQKLLNHKYSPTALDDFLQCQFKFYYKYILNITREGLMEEDIEEQERGRIIHSVLRKAFTPFLGKKINRNQYEEIHQILIMTLEKELESKSLISGEYYVFQKMAEYKLSEFLKKNIYESEKEIEIVALEKNYTMEYQTQRGTVVLEGRIDRVDKRINRHYFEIIDYKTGNRKSKKWYSYKKNHDLRLNHFDLVREKINSFQLPLYLVLFQKNSGLPLSQLNARLYFLGDNQYEDLFDEDTDDFQKRKEQEYYQEGLDCVWDTLLDPEKPLILYENRECPYCYYNTLCNYRLHKK